MRICATCAVEYDEPLPPTCPVCADERQWVPEGGQRWTSLAELAAAGTRLTLTEVEESLLGVRADPAVGIGQQMLVVGTPAGTLLWDPVGFVDDKTVARIAELGPVLAVAASHPHMYGVQLEWAHRLGGAPVLVSAADQQWLGRDGRLVRRWSGRHQVADGLTLHQVGGHFAGGAVAHWAAGAGGRGVLLSGDLVFPNPDRRTVSFMRSFPNHLPLSGGVVDRVATQLGALAFDRIYGNFGNTIHRDALAVLRRSADRHIGWVRGDFDHLT